MAKSPVTGQVKTRLGASVGADHAAQLALAALLDTLAVCESVFPPGHRVVALAGDVEQSVNPVALRQALHGWQVVDQQGAQLAERLTKAHRHTHSTHGGPVVQIGMDTPQVTARHLGHVVASTSGGRPVLGRAHDGGWWVMASTSPADVEGLDQVPMSRPDTWARTHHCLERAAGMVLPTAELGDVDTATDAEAVAWAAPHTAFARAWRRLGNTQPQGTL
jgi:glycosyltransferase A (GT-A) superfamily protein (DUF2064 family)